MFEAVQSVDLHIHVWLVAMRTQDAASFFLYVTLLANWQTCIVVLAIASTAFLVRRNRAYLHALWASVLTSGSIAFLLKYLVARPRPAYALVTELDPSFPSAHATIAVALFGFLAILFLRHVRTPAATWAVRIGATALAVLIGMSRVYLGAHYVSDVLAGYIVGGVGLWVGMSVLRRYGPRVRGAASPSAPGRTSSHTRTAIRVLTASAVLGIAVFVAVNIYRGTLTVTPQAERDRMQQLERMKTHTALSPFVSDGCSGNVSDAWTLAVRELSQLSPEIRARYADTVRIPFEYACETHDRAYYRGEGGYAARLRADNALRNAILEYALTHVDEITSRTGLTDTETVLYLYDLAADIVYRAVRVGGAPCSGQPYAWGYGYGGGTCE